MRLLVIEDDDAIAEPLVAGLRHHGFDVAHVSSGVEALARVQRHDVDLVLLDLGLPDIDGLDVCREIHRNGAVPVIVVTARGDEIDRVVGLELGADDYVVKPFGIRELVARIRAVHRRFEANTARVVSPSAPWAADVNSAAAEVVPTIIVGALVIDQRTRRVKVNGVEVAMTPKEYGVLVALAADPGAVVTRSSLIERVWDEHWYGPTKTLDVHVAQLRQKLGDPGWIETVRGVGYRLVDPETARSHSEPDQAGGVSE